MAGSEEFAAVSAQVRTAMKDALLGLMTTAASYTEPGKGSGACILGCMVCALKLTCSRLVSRMRSGRGRRLHAGA